MTFLSHFASEGLSRIDTCWLNYCSLCIQMQNDERRLEVEVEMIICYCQWRTLSNSLIFPLFHTESQIWHFQIRRSQNHRYMLPLLSGFFCMIPKGRWVFHYVLPMVNDLLRHSHIDQGLVDDRKRTSWQPIQIDATKRQDSGDIHPLCHHATAFRLSYHGCFQ